MMTNTKSEAKNKVLIVICGPTASGKTAVSLDLAAHFHTCIVSTDSRQFYREMPIGTAQPTAEELSHIPHYFIANKKIDEDFNAGAYEKEALALLEELFFKHDILIAAGGSGLYINALCEGFDEFPDAQPGLRATLAARLKAEGLEALALQLKELDPTYYDSVDRNNPARVLRALEVCISTGLPYSAQRSGTKTERPFRIIKVGINMPREALYERINCRVDIMMEAGLETEARALFPYRKLNSLQTVGYRELFGFFNGEYSREEAVELIKRNTRRYAKRQLTWFSKDDTIKWFEPSETKDIIAYIKAVITSNDHS